MTATRTLVRVRNDRVLAGVVGGIAARFGWNATLLRVVYVLVSAFSAAFPGILVYLILWLLIPEEGAA
ncbi:MAG: PspC domain-containing protein [Pseudomonadota bacterium]